MADNASCVDRQKRWSGRDLNGKAIYLGLHGEPATEQRCHQRISEWVTAGKQLPAERMTKAQKAELDAWRRAHRWHPHEPGHNVAVTEIYAEKDEPEAIEAIMKVG